MSEAESEEDYDVFLCHNSSAKPMVVALGERLRKRGLAVWLDVWELRPGMPWIRELEEGIRASKMAAVIVGNDGLGPWQREEFEGLLIKAIRRGIPVIPVILPGVAKPELPLFLETRTWVVLDEIDGFERLVWAITWEKPPASRPLPSYPDERTRELSAALKAARRHRKELARRRQDTTGVEKEILELRRELREGGLKSGDQLTERFELLEPIGQGGFARVWRAWDEKLEKAVALKVMHLQYAEDRTRRERFFRGARQMAQIQHEGIVQVIEPELDDSGYYFFFVMEHLEGGDLRRAVLEKRVAAEDGLRIVRKVGEALAFTHECRIIHRDVKPGNILLDHAGRAKLTDFDLVKAGDTTGGTRTQVAMGSYIYAAPEMCNAKNADARADVYGLAMTAIFVLLGEEIPQDIVRSPKEVLARLPVSEALRGVLARAVAWKPEERTATVAALCEELKEAEFEEGRQRKTAQGEEEQRRKGTKADGESVRLPEYPPRTAERQTYVPGVSSQDMSRRTAIGIDLGTTNSVAAWCASDCKSARVLATCAGENITPSAVSFKRPRREGREGKILVGRRAVNYAPIAPEETILSIKRLMGRKYDDLEIRKVIDRFSYPVVPGRDSDPLAYVQLDGKSFSPAEIASLILRRIKEDASQALSDEVTHAVITVPAYFTEAQRAATREAGERAGLVVKKIIDEPTAAALAFGFQTTSSVRHRLLVYDLGGGTFDLSLVHIVTDDHGNDQFQALQIGGDYWLGGDDFDRPILEKIIAWVRKETREDPFNDRRFLFIAKRAAEEAKRALSHAGETDVIIAAACEAQGGLVDVDFPLTRNELEKMIRDPVAQSMALVEKALREQNLNPDDVTDVLLVGGATLTPIVVQRLEGLFGAAKIRRTVHPMECIALGAAILAATFQGVECPQCRKLNDESAVVCTDCGHFLSVIRSVDDSGFMEQLITMSLGIAAVRGNQKDALIPILAKGIIYPLREPIELRLQALGDRRIVALVYERDPVTSRNSYKGIVDYELKDNPSVAIGRLIV